jgi:hypothetical protein
VNQIGFRVSLQIISLPHPLYFNSSFAHEFFVAFSIAIMSESNGAVRPSNCTAAIDLFKSQTVPSTMRVLKFST